MSLTEHFLNNLCQMKPEIFFFDKDLQNNTSDNNHFAKGNPKTLTPLQTGSAVNFLRDGKGDKIKHDIMI